MASSEPGRRRPRADSRCGWPAARGRSPARSASLMMTRGAKLEKPAPRSGSMTMTRAIFRSRRRAAADRRRSGRASRAPRHRPRPCRARAWHRPPSVTGPPGASATLHPAAQRIARAHRLDCDQPRRAALVVGRPAHAREVRGRGGAQAERRAPSLRKPPAPAGRSTTIASPPSSWRASRARPPLMRSAKKPTAVSAATASVTATTSRRSSPARKSRSNWRQPSRHAEGGCRAASRPARGASECRRRSYRSCLSSSEPFMRAELTRVVNAACSAA